MLFPIGWRLGRGARPIPAGMPIPIKHLERIRAGKTGPCGGNVRGAKTPLEVS